MSRSLNASTLAEIEKDAVRTAHLIQLDLTTTVYMTDAGFDIDYDGDTYTASSHLLEIGSVSESSDVRVGTVSLTLSGVEQTFIAAFLGNNYIGKQAIIYRIFLDSASAIIGDPILIYDGRIDGFDISEGKNDSRISIDLASHWSDFERKAGRYTNPNSQALFFTGDKGFDFAANIVKDIRWGRT
jgi:hypothetical protein